MIPLNNINNYDLRSSQLLVMATHPKVIIPIQLPSPGSCSLPSGSSNDMWPWWYKPSSGNVRSKSSNNEASRRNLWSSVCCREGCGNNAQRSIHSVLDRGTSCNVFFFSPFNLTPLKRKIRLPNRKRYFYFPMFWRLMMISRCWKICVGWPGFCHPCSFDEESLSILKQECNLWWIRMYNLFDPVLQPSLSFGPRIFSGSGTTPRFNLPCHTTSQWGSWRTKMRRAQGALVLIDSKVKIKAWSLWASGWKASWTSWDWKLDGMSAWILGC